MRLAYLNHTRVGWQEWGGSAFVDKVSLLGLNLFVVCESKRNCNLTFFSHLVKSVLPPYMMQMVSLLN